MFCIINFPEILVLIRDNSIMRLIILFSQLKVAGHSFRTRSCLCDSTHTRIAKTKHGACLMCDRAPRGWMSERKINICSLAPKIQCFVIYLKSNIQNIFILVSFPCHAPRHKCQLFYITLIWFKQYILPNFNLFQATWCDFQIHPIKGRVMTCKNSSEMLGSVQKKLY